MGSDASDPDRSLEGLTILVPPGVRPTSLSAVAYYRIRDLVVTLALPPGSEIDEGALQERLHLGRTPVREAVRRLADEGLITIYARRGMVVSPVDVRDLLRISEVRVELESLGARLAAQRAGAEDRRWAAELLTEVRGRPDRPDQAMRDVPGVDDGRAVRALIRTDQRVHHCLHRATGNRYLQDTLGTYLTLSLRLWFLGLEKVRRLDDAVDEHRELLDAVISGDADRAENAAREHVLGFWTEMRSVLVG